MQKVHHFPLIAFFILFQVLFHSIFMVLFIFPSRYFSVINHWFIFLVWEWFPNFPFFFYFHFFSFYTGFPLFFLFLFFSFFLIIDFVRHYFQYLCWFLFLPLLRSFSLWGFFFFGFPFGYSFIADLLQKNFVFTRPFKINV